MPILGETYLLGNSCYDYNLETILSLLDKFHVEFSTSRIAWAREDFSGMRIDSSGWRPRKHFIHFLPAIPFSSLKLCFILYFTQNFYTSLLMSSGPRPSSRDSMSKTRLTRSSSRTPTRMQDLHCFFSTPKPSIARLTCRCSVPRGIPHLKAAERFDMPWTRTCLKAFFTDSADRWARRTIPRDPWSHQYLQIRPNYKKTVSP